MIQEYITSSLTEASTCLNNLRNNKPALEQLEKAGKLMGSAIQAGNHIFSCGNGGSMCDAMHFAEELTGRFRLNRIAMPAVAISDPSHLTCVANDFGYEQVFSRYIEAWGKPGDILLAISTSGTSPNILKAAEAALKKGMHVVSLTGKVDSPISALSTATIITPSEGKWSDRVQELHIKCIHILIEIIENIVLSKTTQPPTQQVSQVEQ